jgi:hypothetical protein
MDKENDPKQQVKIEKRYYSLLEKEKKLEEEALKVAEKKRKAAYELGMKDLKFDDIAS